MGILGGLLDVAGHAVQPALQVATARAQGQLASRQQQMQQVLQQIVLQRQAREDAIKQALAQSTVQHNADLGRHYQNQDAAPKAPIPGSPEWKAAEAYKASLVPRGPMLGSPEYLAAQTDLAKMRAQYRPAPQQSFVFPTVTDDQGKQVVARANTKTGQIEPTDVGAKASATGPGSLSGLAMQQAARMGMSSNDIQQAIQQMERFESNPDNIKKIGVLKATEGAVSQTPTMGKSGGAMGAINNAAGTALTMGARKHLASSDPEYQRYLNNAQRVALAFTEILPRPNQELLHMERGLSGQDIGWNPGMLQDIQTRRRTGLEMLQQVLAKSPMGTGATTSPKGSSGTGGTGSSKGGFDPDAFYQNYLNSKKP